MILHIGETRNAVIVFDQFFPLYYVRNRHASANRLHPKLSAGRKSKIF